jgi:hypothetical protein
MTIATVKARGVIYSMFMVQATVTTIINYARNTLTVQATGL